MCKKGTFMGLTHRVRIGNALIFMKLIGKILTKGHVCLFTYKVSSDVRPCRESLLRREISFLFRYLEERGKENEEKGTEMNELINECMNGWFLMTYHQTS